MQVIPSGEAFGAQRVDIGTSGHGGYWDRDSPSPKNQGAVVVGHYDDVKEDERSRPAVGLGGATSSAPSSWPFHSL